MENAVKERSRVKKKEEEEEDGVLRGLLEETTGLADQKQTTFSDDFRE